MNEDGHGAEHRSNGTSTFALGAVGALAVLSVPATILGVYVLSWSSALGQTQQGYTDLSAWALVVAGYTAVAGTLAAVVFTLSARRSSKRVA